MGSENEESVRFILKLLHDGKEIDAFVGSVEKKEDPQFMQVGQPLTLPASPNISTLAHNTSHSSHDWVTDTRDRLFNPPYRMGRCSPLVVRSLGLDGFQDCHYLCSYCAQSTRSEAQVAADYRFDVACLRMDGVVGSSQPLQAIPLAAFDLGFIDWTGRCITVGILKPYSANARNMSETQKMMNEGRVESLSSSLVTVSARADSGFSGGPIINTYFEIVGMVQGGEGDVIKTVKMIPISDLVRDLFVISYFVPGLPSFQLSTGVGGCPF